MPKKRGELEDWRPQGDYLKEDASGRHILLRGKYQGAYLDTVPKGYVGRFLLQTCRDDMTPQEVALCEKHAGDSAIPKIKRRVKFMETSKVHVEVTAGKGIAEAFDKAAEVGCAQIALTIPVPKSHQKQTALDRLRTRATPLELIKSCFIAEDATLAQQTFQGAVLEYLYERLEEKYKAKCRFKDRSDLLILKTMEEREPARLAQKFDDAVGICLDDTPPHDEGFAPVTKVTLEQRKTGMVKDWQESLLSVIHEIGTDVEKAIEEPVGEAVNARKKSQLFFGIIPALSSIIVTYLPEKGTLNTRGHISLYAWISEAS